MAHECSQEAMRLRTTTTSSNQAGCSPTGSLTTPMTGGPLFCRIRALMGTLAGYEEIYHRGDGSDRIGSRRRLPIQFFVEETFRGWYARTSPPRRWGSGLSVCRCPLTHGRSAIGQRAPKRHDEGPEASPGPVQEVQYDGS